MPTPHDHIPHGAPGHTRAECAMHALESALTLLQLAGMFAAEPQRFEEFRDWTRKYAAANAKDSAEAESAASELDAMEGHDLRLAAHAVETFLLGFTRELRGVPDHLLDIVAGRVPPGFTRH